MPPASHASSTQASDTLAPTGALHVSVVPASVHVRRSWRALFDHEHEAEAFARCWNCTDTSLPPVRVRPRALNGSEVWLRHGTSDAQVLDDTFVGLYHLPPITLPDDAVIVDLGGNIGLTAAHYAAMLPAARVICVEMDAGNARMARRNLAAFGPRVRVVEAAVWSSDGELGYVGTEEWGFRVDSLDGETTTPAGDVHRACRAISMPTLLRECGVTKVDLLKVDIEGAEASVITPTGACDWLGVVQSVKLEYHEPATRESMSAALSAHGLSVSNDPKHPRAVIGVRRA